MGKVNWLTTLLVLFLLSSNIFLTLGIESAKGNPSTFISIQLSGSIAVSNMMKLHVEGTKIVDELGREVKLTGFNSYGRWVDWTRNTDSWNMVPPPPGVTLGQRGDDLIWMKAHGFNSIRALMFWEFFEPVEGTYDEAAFAHLDALVDACEQLGIYVMLESTHWFWSPQFPGGRGFPAWTAVDYPATTSGSHDFALDFLTNNGSAAAARPKFVNIWKYIAQRYSNRTNVIYDFLNEAWNVPQRTGSEEAAAITGYCDFFNNEVTPAIRAIDPLTMITYPAYSWVTPLKKQTHDNIAWTFSMYSYNQAHLGRPYDSVVDGPKIRVLYESLKQKIETEFGSVIILSEVGAGPGAPDTYNENNLLWLNDALAIQKEVFGPTASWMYWLYGKNADVTGERHVPRYNWGTPPILDAPLVGILDDYT